LVKPMDLYKWEIMTADGEVAGVSLSLPDYNRVLAQLDGRLLPLGWIKALHARRGIGDIRSGSSLSSSTPASPPRSIATCGTRACAG
jgi:hypothetical protein